MQEYWRKPATQLRHEQQVLKTSSSDLGSRASRVPAIHCRARLLKAGYERHVHSAPDIISSHQDRMPELLSPSTEAQDRTAEAFHVDEHGELWFRTGDIGAVDEDDFVSLGF